MDRTQSTFLQIDRLSVTYPSVGGNPVRALNNFNLRVHAGEILGILGESGCGKSTFANAVLGLLPHAECISGEILFRGQDLLKLGESQLRSIRGKEISLISQDPALSLNPVLNVGTQIAEVLRAHLQLSAKGRLQRVYDLLQELGFDQPDEIYNSYPHQLSGGQRQRIVIAQAVACRPALLIADEPTSKLDPALQDETVELLAGIRERHGTAILMISHDPALLAALADRIAVMYVGRIVEIGMRSQILQRPLHPYTQALVRLANAPMVVGASGSARFAVVAGDPPDSTDTAVGCCFEPRCSERMQVCRDNDPREVMPEPARFVTCFKHDQ